MYKYTASPAPQRHSLCSGGTVCLHGLPDCPYRRLQRVSSPTSSTSPASLEKTSLRSMALPTAGSNRHPSPPNLMERPTSAQGQPTSGSGRQALPSTKAGRSTRLLHSYAARPTPECAARVRSTSAQDQPTLTMNEHVGSQHGSAVASEANYDQGHQHTETAPCALTGAPAPEGQAASALDQMLSPLLS